VLRAEDRECPTWQIRNHESGEHALFDLALLAGETDHPFRLQCEQAVLTRHLAQRFERTGEVAMRPGERVTALGQDAGQALGADTARGRRRRGDALRALRHRCRWFWLRTLR